MNIDHRALAIAYRVIGADCKLHLQFFKLRKQNICQLRKQGDLRGFIQNMFTTRPRGVCEGERLSLLAIRRTRNASQILRFRNFPHREFRI